MVFVITASTLQRSSGIENAIPIFAGYLPSESSRQQSSTQVSAFALQLSAHVPSSVGGSHAIHVPCAPQSCGPDVGPVGGATGVTVPASLDDDAGGGLVGDVVADDAGTTRRIS